MGIILVPLIDEKKEIIKERMLALKKRAQVLLEDIALYKYQSRYEDLSRLKKSNVFSIAYVCLQDVA